MKDGSRSTKLGVQAQGLNLLQVLKQQCDGVERKEEKANLISQVRISELNANEPLMK